MIGAIIGWIIIGAIAGVLGKLIMPGDDPGGIIVTILLGIAGAFVGGFIMQTILGFGSGGFIWTILVATLGAVILLAIYRAFVGSRSRRT
ncbi:MAG TPA: GlsB/YeaQ/YmgE family stress response membrane protein [Rubrobacteraceae bacterium]|nr:GlsB/YeaQ/YmgE family stress response membrane protein [Rubrobacteraceae bacterium]